MDILIITLNPQEVPVPFRLDFIIFSYDLLKFECCLMGAPSLIGNNYLQF